MLHTMRRLLLVLLAAAGPAAAAVAQEREIRGTVSSAADGEPLMGVTVVVKGGSAGTVTGNGGAYSIMASDGDVLVYSFLGMLPVEEAVGTRAVIDVRMESDAKVIEGVMVVAYGTASKDSFTGSAEVVSEDKLMKRPVTNVSKVLDGQVAGVMTTSGSGQPGEGSSISVRGFGSINASNNPLLVVDGIPYDGDLNSLNSGDIESMTVLKDASAGALYGSRGGNGVVIITTKRSRDKGREHMQVSFSARGGVSSRAIPPYETLGAKDYMELMYRATYNDLVYTEGYLPGVAQGMVPDRLAGAILGRDNVYNIYDRDIGELFDREGRIVPGASLRYNEEWMKEIRAKMPVRQEYQLSVNGGSEKAQYMASLSYLDEEGLLATTGFSRYTGRVNVDFTPKKWFKMGVNINYARTDTDFLGAEGSNLSNVWYSAQMMAPIYPVYRKNPDGSNELDANGNRQFDYGASRPAGAQNNKNSVAMLYDDKYYTVSDNVGLRTYGELLWNGFSLRTNFGADNINANETTYYNPYFGNAAGTGRLTKENGRTFSYTWNQLLSYNKKFGRHSVDAMVGHEFYNYRFNYLVAERTGFPFGGMYELSTGSTISEANSAQEEYSLDSYMSRFNYNYADRYYFSASYRYDESSRFAKRHRGGHFWSVGASWRISEEPFMDNVKWVDNLTLKASYGVQGNDNIGTYYAWQSFYNMSYPNANFSGAVVSSLQNDLVTWEKNGNLNIGVEFRLLNRFRGTVEWYQRNTWDLLLQYPKAPSTGFEYYNANVGGMVNSGFDITLGAEIIKTRDWNWDVTVMASTLRNRVKRLTNDNSSIINGNNIIKVGEELNSFYLAKSAGVDPTTGEQLYWAYMKNPDGSRIEGSDYITADGTVATNSRHIFESRIPDVYGSVSTTLTYRNFDFNLMMTYSIGGKIYDAIYNSMMEPSYVGQTYHKNAMRGWSEVGQVTDVPRVTTTLTTIASDRFLVDASYFAIKNVSLGYTFPSAWMSRAKIDTLRVFLSVDSPYVFTSLRGLNPQSNFTGTTSYSYTPNRVFMIGLDLKF